MKMIVGFTFRTGVIDLIRLGNRALAFLGCLVVDVMGSTFYFLQIAAIFCLRIVELIFGANAFTFFGFVIPMIRYYTGSTFAIL